MWVHVSVNSLERMHWLLYQCDRTGGSWSSVVPESDVSSAKLQRVWPPRCCLCSPEPQTPGRPIPGKPAAEPHGAEGGHRSRKDAPCLLFYSFCCWWWCYHQACSLCFHQELDWAPVSCHFQLHYPLAAGTWASPALPPTPLFAGSMPLTCCWKNEQERPTKEEIVKYFYKWAPLGYTHSMT